MLAASALVGGAAVVVRAGLARAPLRSSRFARRFAGSSLADSRAPRLTLCAVKPRPEAESRAPGEDHDFMNADNKRGVRVAGVLEPPITVFL